MNKCNTNSDNNNNTIKNKDNTGYQVDDRYLLRAKFMNDSNFFVLEAARGKSVLERSLDIAEVLLGGGRR